MRMNDTFLVNDITNNDIERNLIRIIVNNKKFFPGSDNIDPKSYSIRIKVNSEIYDGTYRVEKKWNIKNWI